MSSAVDIASSFIEGAPPGEVRLYELPRYSVTESIFSQYTDVLSSSLMLLPVGHPAPQSIVPLCELFLRPHTRPIPAEEH